MSVKIEERGSASVTISGVDPEDYYNAILIESKYVASMNEHFFEIEFTPKSIKIDGKEYEFYPEDRHRKLNESGFLSNFDHGFIQRIPIADKSAALSGKIEIEATLSIKLYSKMISNRLSENFKGGSLGNTRIQILKIQGTNAILKFKNFDNNIGILGIGDNDKQLNSFVTNMPIEIYEYLVRKQNYNQENYEAFLSTIDFENKKLDEVIKVFAGSSASVDLEKLIFFKPAGEQFIHEEVMSISN